jgi:hypothetical protein
VDWGTRRRNFMVCITDEGLILTIRNMDQTVSNCASKKEWTFILKKRNCVLSFGWSAIQERAIRKKHLLNNTLLIRVV